MKILHLKTDKTALKFTLAGVNVSIANAIRRTILTDIPVCGIVEDTCVVAKNTSRMHNEIIKHRLSCVPVYVDERDIDNFAEKYELFVDLENNTEATIYVTTEHFRVREKSSGEELSVAARTTIFPPNTVSGYYIDFARLRARIGGSIPGETLQFVAGFARMTAHYSATYTAVSCCSYANTPDPTAADERWRDIAAARVAAEVSAADIENERRDFVILDAQRYFVPDSYDFVVESIGVYDNTAIVRMACTGIAARCREVARRIEAQETDISPSATEMIHCYDLKLEGEDYTIGKVLEAILYESLFVSTQILAFCGFKKFHPHDLYSVLRLTFTAETTAEAAGAYVVSAATTAATAFDAIAKLIVE
jgi:DNA-directed RNA polymerase subunit L